MLTFQVSNTNNGAIETWCKKFNKLRSSGQDISVIHRGLDRASQKAYKDARVRTGYMRSTIEVKRDSGGVAVSVGAFYSVFIERGTEHHRAFPFFFGNVYAEVDTIRNEFRALYMK